jgi:hypothetical protein
MTLQRVTGNVLIGTTTEGHEQADNLTVSGSGHTGITIRSTNSNETAIFFSDGTSGSAEYRGSLVYNHATENMRFATAGTERMRIASTGLTDLFSSTTTFRLRTGGTGTSTQLLSGAEGASDVTNGTERIVIFANGNIQNTNNSYGSLSDEKIKENIADATDKLEDIKKVKIRNFNIIGDSTKQIGVVAQELETVFPALIETIKDIDYNAVDEDGNNAPKDLGTETKSVKYSVFVPILIKAMQEQQTLIEALTDRITALEG